MKYRFEIKEKAIGKQKPRYSSKMKRMYTPEKTSSFEEKVKWAFKAKYNIETELSTKPFKAKIIAIFFIFILSLIKNIIFYALTFSASFLKDLLFSTIRIFLI